MFGRRAHDQRKRQEIDVWLSPAAGVSVSDLAHQIAADVHLIVVPKTGSRQADVAVLRDPTPVELVRVARLLPGTPLIVTTAQAPARVLWGVARQLGAHVLTAPSPSELLSEIHLCCDPESARSMLASA